jgi:hypothetical protein
MKDDGNGTSATVGYNREMTTTVDIPKETLDRVMLASGASSPQEAVLKAVEEYARVHGQKDLIKYLGTFEDFMTPEELDTMREMD